MLEKGKSTKKRKSELLSLFKITPSSLFFFFLGWGAGLVLCPLFESWQTSSTQNPHIEVCFSPEGECPYKIIATIDSAQSSIFVMAYSFTSQQIAQALVAAHMRGVKVKILIDRSRLKEKNSQLSYFFQNKIPIFVDSPAGVAHNKVILIDDHLLITGSFNWTQNAATKNAENVLLIDDPSLVYIYKQNWDYRVLQSNRLSSKDF